MSLVATVALVASPSNGRSEATGVVLIVPAKVIAQDQTKGQLALKLDNLARIDPAHPLADDDAEQTLSMFGREDLIAATSEDYKPTACRPLESAADPLVEIERRARLTSVVIINESHARSDHRGFTTAVMKRLRPLGYDMLAMETLSHDAPDLKEEFRPPLLRQPNLPYLSDDDGFYLSEAGFGRLGRTAKALGYRLLPYEMIFTGPPPADATPAQQIAQREEAQASTLAAFVKAHPTAKLLVHVGYHHVLEVPTAKGDSWMAARLKAKTGIDPLTISQTTCRGGSDTVRLSHLPPSEPKGAFDLVVDHPTARFVEGRPAWRVATGDRPIAIPPALIPASGWRVIEARPVGEPDTSVPMDRVAIRSGETIALMLPAGRYQLRAIDIKRTTPDTSP